MSTEYRRILFPKSQKLKVYEKYVAGPLKLKLHIHQKIRRKSTVKPNQIKVPQTTDVFMMNFGWHRFVLVSTGSEVQQKWLGMSEGAFLTIDL